MQITDETVLVCLRAVFSAGRPCAYARYRSEIEPCASDCLCVKTTRLIVETALPLIRAAVVGEEREAAQSVARAYGAHEVSAAISHWGDERDKGRRIINQITNDQEPLGADFEAVWDANTERLHEP